MNFNILQALKGIGGEFEINRLVGALGATVYIFTAAGLAVYEVVWRGLKFDMTAWCTLFPAGLGIAVGSIAGAVALKDRSVAIARQTTAQPPLSDTTTETK